MSAAPAREDRDRLLDLRLRLMGVQRKPRVHNTVGAWNYVVPCGDPRCDVCAPPRPRRRRTLRG